MADLKIPEITVTMPVASAEDMSDNRNAVHSAFQSKRQAKMRVNIGVYAPGTVENPKARYYWFLGTSPTIICRTPAGVDHAMKKLHELMLELNGWHG